MRDIFIGLSEFTRKVYKNEATIEELKAFSLSIRDEALFQSVRLNYFNTYFQYPLSLIKSNGQSIGFMDDIQTSA